MTDTSKPAFPCTGEGFDDPRYHTPGMTIRQYAAIKAMQGMIMAADFRADPVLTREGAMQSIAVSAVRMADLLLAELNKDKEE